MANTISEKVSLLSGSHSEIANSTFLSRYYLRMSNLLSLNVTPKREILFQKSFKKGGILAKDVCLMSVFATQQFCNFKS